MTEPSNRRWWNQAWLAGLFLVALTVIAYQPAWSAGFIWDDDAYVTHNSLLTAPDGLKRIWFSLDSPSQYFPLVYTTFRLERALWGLNPAGYHWVNIVLHAVNALLAWRLLARLKIPGAWLAAAIFALHPVNVESVAWVTELKNVQSMFFFLLSLLAWVAFVDEPPRRRWYAMALLFYMLALFSKTTACTLPAALLLVLWLQKKPIGWFRILQMVPFVLLGIGMGLISMWWERHHQGTEGQAFGLGAVERVLIASRAIWFYTGKLLWPANLTFNYPLWKIDASSVLAYVWLVVGAGLCALIYYSRRFVGRSAEVAAVFFVATLSPLLGFIMLYTFHYTFVADHYQYVACLGPMALVAAGITIAGHRFSQSRNAACQPAVSTDGSRPTAGSVGVGLVLCSVLAVLTWRQCRMYSDIETLWRATLVRNPDSFMAYNNLGDVLMKQGRLEEAVANFQETLRIKPDSAQAHCNLGVALFQSGQAGKAVLEYQKALQIQPGLAEAHKNLSDVFLQEGQLNEAIAQCLKALELKPDFADAHQNLGNAFLQTGRVDEAIPHLEKALELQPDFPNALNNLGIAFIQKGQTAKAATLFQRAVEIQPDFAEAHNNLGKLAFQKGDLRKAVEHYRLSLNIQPNDPDTSANLAWVLATSPDASIRNGAEAIDLAQRANALTGGSHPMILGTLAAAYAEGGRFADALKMVQRAVELAESHDDAGTAEALRSQARLYKAGMPVRDMGATSVAGGP